MVRYFDDFELHGLRYRPRWIEFTKGTNVHRVRDNEGMKVFQRQGWEPKQACYVRLYGGQVDTGVEHIVEFGEYLRIIG